MSKYWGYVCQSHTPELESERWFNHGEATLTEAFVLERAGQWPNDQAYEPGGTWWALGPQPAEVAHQGTSTKEPIDWLREHPHCTVALRNEHGDTEPLFESTINRESIID